MNYGAPMAALRALVSGDVDASARLARRVVEDGDGDDLGRLAYIAFVAAVRRRFAPRWTLPQIIRFIAAKRAYLLRHGIDIDPSTAEALTRRALGDTVDGQFDDEASARAQIFLLIELIDDEEFDDAGLDAFLAEVRSLADQTIS